MAGGVSVELNVGVGSIVTVTFCVLVQPFAVKANTYVTVTGSVALLVSVSLTVAFEPVPVSGVMPVTAARDQPNVVPAVALVAV